MDWEWTGGLFLDAGHSAALTMIVALGEGLVAGAITVVLTLMYARRR